MTQYNSKKLIIVGGGHASLPLIKMGEKWKSIGLEIVLISENPYLIYSGALPQFMGGFYEWSQTAIDLKRLCNRYGVTFVESRVESISDESSTLTASNQKKYTYDYLLINVGAETTRFTSSNNSVPVKPMNELISLRERLKEGGIKKLLIAGGGAAGAELALNISHPNSFADPEITILDKNSRLLSSFPQIASDNVTSILKSRAVQIHTNTAFTPAMTDAYDAVIVAVGNRPGSQSITHSFSTGAGGRILTDDTLMVAGEKSIFAAGDTANVDGQNYREIGVHAVKQGVILRQNIEALHMGEKLLSYSPYPFNPLIISDGSDHAFYVLKKFAFYGRWAAILKYILDMKWLEKYTKPKPARRPLRELLHQGIIRSDS